MRFVFARGFAPVTNPRYNAAREPKIRGHSHQLPKVVQSVTFRNGVKVTDTPAQNAA